MYYVKQLLSDDNSIYYDMLKDGLQGDYDIITYRKHYDCINGDVIDAINEKILNYSNYEIEYYYKNNIASYIIDSLKAYSHLSLKKAIKLAQLLKTEKSDDAIICATLQALFNKRYEVTVLRGCCQDDWMTCYYAIDDIQYDYIRYIEAVMFNTGFEIMIHEGDDIPQTADDIDGYSDYIAFNSCDMLDDIAAYLNTSKDNIKFYEIEKTVQYTKIIYKEVI